MTPLPKPPPLHIDARASDYAIYKPNSRGSGGVVRFGLNRAKASVFVDATLQSGEKQFDWENKITMKWGLSDLGTVLATLQGRTAPGQTLPSIGKGQQRLRTHASRGSGPRTLSPQHLPPGRRRQIPAQGDHSSHPRRSRRAGNRNPFRDREAAEVVTPGMGL